MFWIIAPSMVAGGDVVAALLAASRGSAFWVALNLVCAAANLAVSVSKLREAKVGA